MTEPFLAVIDDLRRQIAERQAAIDALERIVGVKTLSTSPAPNALPAPRPTADASPPPPAGERKRAGKVDIEKLRALYSQGLDDGQIGKQLGVSGSAILLWRKKLGLSANGKGGRKTPAEPASAPITAPVVVNSAATIVSWLRQRDTIIAEVDPGKTWKVNGRDIIDRAGLLTMANRKREIAKLPPFAWEHG